MTTDTSTSPLSIAIVDNDAMSLALIRDFVRRACPNHTVVWAVTDGYEAIDRCLDPTSAPSLLMVDMSLNTISGLRVCKILRERTDSILLLAITAFPLQEYAARAAQMGCQGIIEKKNIPTKINYTVETLFQGNTYSDTTAIHFETSEISHKRLTAQQIKQTNVLSFRETEVINQCLEGYSLIEIASNLNISDATVRTHISHIKNKLGAKNLSQAAIAWYNMKNM